MLFLENLIENRIRQAEQNGDFQDLPSKGKPLTFDDNLFVSPEQRLYNYVLKNSGMLPNEIVVRKRIFELKRQINEIKKQYANNNNNDENSYKNNKSYKLLRYELTNLLLELKA